MTQIKVRYSVLAVAVLFASACNNLDVTNPNQPDIQRALSSPADVQALAQSTLNTFYISVVSGDGGGPNPSIFGCVTADVCTMNYGNFGARFNNLQPRIPLANSTASNDRVVTEQPWYQGYGTIGAANDVLTVLNLGLSLGSPDETEKYKELAQFSQAATYTYLSMEFDQAFVVTQFTDKTAPSEMVGHTAVRDSTMRMWDNLIAAASQQNFSYALTDLPMPDGALTSARLTRIANTMAAMALAYHPRNPAQAASVDWARVAAYANKGIGTGSGGAPFDWVIQDDNNKWYSLLAMYGDYGYSGSGWVRTDHRVINRMNPSVPPEYDGTDPGPGTSPDARYTTDYKYATPPIGDASRGKYMQSLYWHKRYEFTNWDQPNYGTGNVPFILAAESDLIRAEALIRSNGSLQTAADLINKTRVGRGNLTPATAADGSATLLSYISYERDVEITNTSATTLYWRRAVTDQPLRAGTPCQLPVPAKELETLSLPIYTFGGAGNDAACK